MTVGSWGPALDQLTQGLGVKPGEQGSRKSFLTVALCAQPRALWDSHIEGNAGTREHRGRDVDDLKQKGPGMTEASWRGAQPVETLPELVKGLTRTQF